MVLDLLEDGGLKIWRVGIWAIGEIIDVRLPRSGPCSRANASPRLPTATLRPINRQLSRGRLPPNAPQVPLPKILSLAVFPWCVTTSP